MYLQKLFKLTPFFTLIGLFLLFAACDTMQQKEEVVNIDELLPEGAVKEFTLAFEGFEVALVAEEDANVAVKFGEQFIRIKGIEDQERRERVAKYIVEYLENPNKKAEDAAKKQAYQNLPPKEKMASFVERMKKHYPYFEYKWVQLGEGNVKVEYGDNSLLISGVDNEGAREEIAHGVMQIQKEIDKLNKGEQE